MYREICFGCVSALRNCCYCGCGVATSSLCIYYTIIQYYLAIFFRILHAKKGMPTLSEHWLEIKALVLDFGILEFEFTFTILYQKWCTFVKRTYANNSFNLLNISEGLYPSSTNRSTSFIHRSYPSRYAPNLIVEVLMPS